MRHPTDRRQETTGRSARAAIDPYIIEEITFTRTEIMTAREEILAGR